jgi:hypothetical protein
MNRKRSKPKSATKKQRHTRIAEIFNLHLHHPAINAEDWRSPLAYRLLGSKSYQDGERLLQDSFKDDLLQISEGQLWLRWEGLARDFNRRLKTYQEHILTEHAALGLACLLVHGHLKMSISEVARLSEKADYWLANGMLLEVTGRQSANLEILFREKRTQLLANPFQQKGYTCVVCCSTMKARLWFCSAEDGYDD